MSPCAYMVGGSFRWVFAHVNTPSAYGTTKRWKWYIAGLLTKNWILVCVSSVLFISSQAAMAFFLFLNNSEHVFIRIFWLMYTYSDIIVLDDFMPRDIYLSYTILSNGRHCEGSCILWFRVQHFPVIWFAKPSATVGAHLSVLCLHYILQQNERVRTNWAFPLVVLFVVPILPSLHRSDKTHDIYQMGVPVWKQWL